MPVPWKSYGVNPGSLHADPGSEAAAEWGAEKTEPRGSDEPVARERCVFLPNEEIRYTWNLFVLYFGGLTLQNKAEIPIKTRVIWVPGKLCFWHLAFWFWKWWISLCLFLWSLLVSQGYPQDIIKNALNPSTRQASIEYVTVGTLLRRAVSDISLQQLGLEGSDYEQYPRFSNACLFVKCLRFLYLCCYIECGSLRL